MRIPDAQTLVGGGVVCTGCTTASSWRSPSVLTDSKVRYLNAVQHCRVCDGKDPHIDLSAEYTSVVNTMIVATPSTYGYSLDLPNHIYTMTHAPILVC